MYIVYIEIVTYLILQTNCLINLLAKAAMAKMGTSASLLFP